MVRTELDQWKVEEDGCWIWRGMRSWNGYGLLKRSRKQVKAHRVIYELYVGQIPSDKEIHHECRNRLCVNPAHMTVVTRQKHIES